MVLAVYRERDALFSLLHVEKISRYSDSEFDVVAHSVYDAMQRGIIQRNEIGAAICPPTTALYSMVASDEYIRRKCTIFAQEKGYYGDFYRKVLVLRPTVVASQERFESLFRMFISWHASFVPDTFDAPITLPGEIEPPRAYRLRQGHQTALDLFFNTVKTLGDEQIGPALFAHSPGMVVAASQGWDSDVEKKEGGLSPHSGNGVIMYDPFTERYYFYFHMYDVAVKTGQIIYAGTYLGRGGNTGINARKPNKGEHVHVEVYDIQRKEFLSVYEIKELIYDPYY